MMRLHKPHVVMTLLTALFSREKLYNPTTTRKPIICQFFKNTHLISALIAAPYKKVKI